MAQPRPHMPLPWPTQCSQDQAPLPAGRDRAKRTRGRAKRLWRVPASCRNPVAGALACARDRARCCLRPSERR
eukprot:4706155-Prymnesium_polylepis.1